MKKKKILYGIAGIGLGHTYRQLPIIEYLAKKYLLVIFAYDKSYEFYSSHFKNRKSVYVDGLDGLNFKATLNHPYNKDKDFLKINLAVIDRTYHRIGKPDLVITDYEPISASYSYIFKTPLITIDQQSKYLYGRFPMVLKDQSFKDEVERLNLFFPKANKRIACSFFRVYKKENGQDVTVYSPIIRKDIIKLKRKPSKKQTILFYISSQKDFVQSYKSIIDILNSQDASFYIFMKDSSKLKKFSSEKISFYDYGDHDFYKILRRCNGIISTAGHNLISEAMYLRIPVYAIPLSIYEQHMNAQIIDKHGFGISNQKIDKRKLAFFIKNIPKFARNIKDDSKILLRGSSQQKIIQFLENIINKSS